ncbi:MAG: hypothetical protein EA398_07050 [Deltaproteobacteria bacterium]|nr:MAG: hypothetical protein EA398_07050 [Deltaproteobacteria bacterium]
MATDEPRDVPPPGPQDDEEQRRLRSRVEGLFRDVLRRTVHSGVSTAIQTEESLRNIVGEIKLPREVVGYLLQQIDTTKKELVAIAAREFREFLESANLGEEIARILTTLSFEIRTEVRFIPNDQALRPNVSSKISVRNRNSGETVSEEEDVGPLDDVIRDAASDLAGRILRTGKAARANEAGPDDDGPDRAKATAGARKPAPTPAATTAGKGEGTPQPAKKATSTRSSSGARSAKEPAEDKEATAPKRAARPTPASSSRKKTAGSGTRRRRSTKQD